MKVKEIIDMCLKKLGWEDLIDKETYTSDEQKLIDRLVFNVNVVCREIATCYLNIIESRDIEVENGEYVFANLTGVRLLYPVRLMVGNKEIAYKVYATKLKCDYSGKATLYYACLPSKEYTIDDEIGDTRITLDALCAGALSEYCLQNKDFYYARVYDSTFRTEMNAIKYGGKN